MNKQEQSFPSPEAQIAALRILLSAREGSPTDKGIPDIVTGEWARIIDMELRK